MVRGKLVIGAGYQAVPSLLRYPAPMPVLTVGDTAIPYEIRRSRRARQMRITVRPGEVRVSAPLFVRQSKIEALVESKSRWILEKTKALLEREIAAIPERFISGEQVLVQDQQLTLLVEPAEVTKPTLLFSDSLQVKVPAGLDTDTQEELVRNVVMKWLEERALEEAKAWTAQHGRQLGRYPTRIRIGNQKTLWGSCSARGVIALNWRLIATPRRVFEYVVVHEMCHLVERNHGPEFWKLVESLLPDFAERRAWLKEHGVALG
jgi:predicted metal-dependent hydrolase